MEETITKGYKVTNPNLTCQSYTFEIGKLHEQNGPLVICKIGFHFCKKLSHCFGYYSFDKMNRVFEIEAYGETVTKGDKSASLKIKLLRELTWEEVLRLANEGYDNTGHSNTGYSNTGDRNTGDRNTGNRNTGAFCTGEPPFPMFNKPSNWTANDFLNSIAWQLLQQNVNTKLWVPSHKMTDQEKKDHRGWEPAQGFCRDIPFKEAFKNAWGNWDKESRQQFIDLPNFDPTIFEFITSVKIDSAS